MNGARGPRQLTLDLDHAESFARDDFLGGPIECRGADADRQLARLAEPDRGPGRAGGFRQESPRLDLGGAVPARAVSPRARSSDTRRSCRRSRPARWWSRTLPKRTFDETALFHLLNLAREEAAYVLLTARTAPAAWTIRTPDLASRLKALPVVALAPPDDALLRAVLVKLFADRQLGVDEQPDRIRRDPDRAILRRRAGGGGDARRRSHAAEAALNQGFGGRSAAAGEP